MSVVLVLVDGDDARALLPADLPDGFDRRVITIPPGTTHPYDPSAWRDALVLVEAGEIELHGWCGTRRTLGSGAVFWLDQMPLRTIGNRGQCPAVLVAVSRSVES